MARYCRVSSVLWTEPKFIALSDADRVVYIYLATCEHQTSVGCARVPRMYAAADLRRATTEFAESVERLQAATLIVGDPETEEFFVCNWFETNGPTNPRHLAGLLKRIDEIRSPRVRERAREAFRSRDWEFSSKPEAREPRKSAEPRKKYGATDDVDEIGF